MSLLVVSLLLASALIHAGWNAIVKSGDDRLWSISIICLAGAVTALPFAFVLEPPAPTSWVYILMSSVLQIGYSLFLVRAYRDWDMASVYPIARGSAPLLVTIGAAIFAGELPGMLGLAGIALVSLGIMALAFRNTGADAKSIGAALAAGLFIASYMVADGLGVRLADSAVGYAAWQAVVAGFLIPLAIALIRRQAPRLPRGKEDAAVVGAGILATLGYAIAVWAMSLTTMGGVSAIRESSILFAALIGIFVLGEKMTFPKITGAMAVTAGVVLLSIG